MCKVPSFFTSSITLCIVSHLDCSSSTGLVGLSHCHLDVYFPINNDIGHIFMCLLAIHVYSMVKCFIKSCVYFVPGCLPFIIGRVLYIF